MPLLSASVTPVVAASPGYGVAAERPPDPYESIGLPFLMARGEGRRDVAIGLVDGPIAASDPVFASASIRIVGPAAADESIESAAGIHGTYVASLLAAGRDAETAGICPGCTLIARPVLGDRPDGTPSTTAEDLARAMADCLDAGARILLVTSALRGSRPRERDAVIATLDDAMRRDVLVVAAAGNDGRMDGSPITQHGWVLPVVALTVRGTPWPLTNLGLTMARSGVAVPGTGIKGHHPRGVTLEGTSIAAPLLAGTLALLWSEFPGARGANVRSAVVGGQPPRSLVPPRLDVAAAHRRLATLMRAP